MQLVLDDVQGKTFAASTGSATQGKLVIGTSALAGGGTGVLATVDLPTTPFSLSAAVLTLLGVPHIVTATAGGTAAKAELRRNDGTVVRDGLTVGTSGTHVIITNTAVEAGDEVKVTALTITHP